MSGITEDDLVVCEACSVIHEQATAVLCELRERVEVLKTELTTKAIQNSRLKGLQAKNIRTHPLYEQACSILEMWKATCSPRSKAVTDERAKLVVGRLKDFSAEELEQCVLGYAKFPYVVNRQRTPAGKPSERFVKAETIFADAGRVERGIELADRGDDAMRLSEVLISRLPWRRVWQANRRSLLRWLRNAYGALNEDGYGNTISPCPRCEQGFEPLQIFARDDGPIARCSQCGATEVQLLAMLDQRKVAA